MLTQKKLQMLTLFDVTFHAHTDCDNGLSLIKSHSASLGYIDFIKADMQPEVIKHMQAERHYIVDSTRYHFFENKNKFFSLPYKTYKYILKHKPAVVLVQGLVFPFQIIMLRLLTSKRTIILAQHHGEKSARTFKGRLLHRIADKCITAYLFNSIVYAQDRLEKKLISRPDKIFQLQEGSNYFRKNDKQAARTRLQIKADGPIFLWVGRLNDNKDPLTILKAFESYLQKVHAAKLYMIYQTKDLIDVIEEFLNANDLLFKSVILLGRIPHAELETWYNAADYFISGSKFEYGGFALLEAMACGCIPIASDLPTTRLYFKQERYGFLFPSGDHRALFAVLMHLNEVDTEKLSCDIAEHFQRELSFEKIASDLTGICEKLSREQLHYPANRFVNVAGADR